MNGDLRDEIEASYRNHERLLWGLSYRMTGSAADADEIVQETFVRALRHPPAELGRSLRPWLVRVATNLAVDALRRRKRTPYVGPWLPEPIETPADLADVPGARYEQIESVTFAFLRALEALPPKQRAVLLLRDVLDYSVRETAGALDVAEGHVKVLHHRARRKMASYDAARSVPDAALEERTRRALEGFVSALLSGDARAVEEMLAVDARTLTDAAGVYRAARKVVVGRERVARFYHRVVRANLGADARMDVDIRTVNGLPAMVGSFGGIRPGSPPRQIVLIDTDGEGHIRHIDVVAAPAKLGRIFRA